MNEYLQKLRDIVSKINFRSKTTWVFAFCLFIGIFVLFRSCTRELASHQTVFIIARDTTWHSLQLFGKEKNLTAFTNELMTTITSETGLHFRWLETNSNTLLEVLSNGECDGVLTTLRPTTYNRQTYLFSDLFLETGPVLLVRADSKINSLQDLRGQVVGLAWSAPLLYNAAFQSNTNAYNILIINYVSATQALDALIKDQLDGVILETTAAYTLAENQYAGKVKIVNRPITDEGLRLITLKNDAMEEFIAEFNGALSTLRQDGDYTQLIDKWNLFDPEKRFLPHQ